MTVEENLKFRQKIIKRQFKERVGYDLNLDAPKAFNDKMLLVCEYAKGI